MNPNSSQRPIVIWLLSGCFLIFLMVIIGGITRLTHSGLSIVEWDLLMGILPPMSEQGWSEMFEKYRQSPQFIEHNYYFSLEDFKSIFWWEYVHRLVGRFIGIVFIIPFLYFCLKEMLSPSLMVKCGVIFLLGAFQGFLGWFMVKSGLVREPAVSHFRLAAHLLTAFLTFGYTFWVALDIVFLKNAAKTQNPTLPNNPNNSFRYLVITLFSVILLQIIYGAFVAGLRAGYVFNTFPMMGDQWIPPAVTALSPIWKNFTDGMAGVQFVHRMLAMVIALLTGLLWFRTKKHYSGTALKKVTDLLALIVLLQITLGILTLVYAVPVVLAIAHQAMAFVLFAAILLVLHRIRT